jgi:hypothetical protein
VLPGAYNLLVNTLEGEHSAWALRSLSVGPAGEDGLIISPGPYISNTGRIRVDGGADTMDLSQVHMGLYPMYQSGTVYGATARKDGTLKFADLPPGRYRVLFTGAPEGSYLKTVRSGDRDWLGRILDLSAGAPSVVEALFRPKAASVTGTVVSADSDSPAPEATVVLIPQDQERRDDLFAYPKAMTDESGKFAIRSLPPGEYRAFAWASVRDNIYMDPDFIRPLETKGVALTLTESSQTGIKLSLIIDSH